ncbi:TPA: hypothetical protein ACOEP6_004619 [Enterobacter ludwigii]
MLQTAPEALHDRIIPAGAHVAHAAPESVTLQQRLEACTGVLGSTVRISLALAADQPLFLHKFHHPPAADYDAFFPKFFNQRRLPALSRLAVNSVFSLTLVARSPDSVSVGFFTTHTRRRR